MRTLTVLLVEDNVDHATIITRAIGDFDPLIDVHPVRDGESATVYLSQESAPPDLVLLDINMPGLSGFDVLEHIKGDPRLKAIPVVVLTSSELPSDITRAYQLGASGYVSKPTYLQDLRATLRNVMLYWSAMRRTDAGEHAE